MGWSQGPESIRNAHWFVDARLEGVQKTSGGGVRAWVHVFISMGDHRPGSTKFHQGELAEVP